MKKQNKTDNQRQESTIDKYFENTSKGFDEWVEENKKERSYLLIAAECTGDKDEEGNKFFDFHIAYSGKPDILASGLMHSMKRDEFVRQLIIGAAKMYYIAIIKIKDNEADN